MVASAPTQHGVLALGYFFGFFAGLSCTWQLQVGRVKPCLVGHNRTGGLVVPFDQGIEQSSTDSEENEEQTLSGVGPAQQAIVRAGMVPEWFPVTCTSPELVCVLPTDAHDNR